MIAVILAGGRGERLKARPVPKPLINILDQPVINDLVDKLLALGKETVTEIYVLTPKRQPDLDLKRLFKFWKSEHYPDEQRVRLLFEEDLPPSGAPVPGATGAIIGLDRFARHLPKLLHRKPTPSHILVLAGDNVFQDDLTQFIDDCRSWPTAVINAFYDFHDHHKVARKYGAVTLDDDGWVVDLVEKPENPQHDQTRASLAIYGFPFEQFSRVAEYVEQGSGRVDAPGQLLSWLVKEQQRTGARAVRGYELQGKWSDIGNVRDLLAAVIWSAAARIDRLETVRHLLVAEDVDKLDDKSFFMCHEIEVDGPTRTLRLFFLSDDPICKLDRSFGRAPAVKSVAKRSARDEIWQALNRIFSRVPGPSPGPSLERRRLGAPMLLSAGVCLLDTSNADQITVDGSTFNVLAGDRTLIPLLERDAAAPVDPGRLTTAAGRLDMLDIDHVCYAELLEELVFYGTDDLRRQTRLYCCSPPDRDAKGRLLNRILEKRLEVPGIDRATIAAQAALQEKDIEIVVPVEPTALILPPRHAWTVEMHLDGSCVNRHDSMCVVADQPNGTLEFRRLAWANMTHFVPPNADRASKRVGRLLGIADGDGHGRRAFLMRARVLIDYQQQMIDRDKDDICEYIFSSQKESVKILGLTDGVDGRFSRMDAPVPLLSFTTSLSHLTDLMASIVR